MHTRRSAPFCSRRGSVTPGPGAERRRSLLVAAPPPSAGVAHAAAQQGLRSWDREKKEKKKEGKKGKITQQGQPLFAPGPCGSPRGCPGQLPRSARYRAHGFWSKKNRKTSATERHFKTVKSTFPSGTAHGQAGNRSCFAPEAVDSCAVGRFCQRRLPVASRPLGWLTAHVGGRERWRCARVLGPGQLEAG